MAALGNLPPDIEPRATEYIPQMIRMIERLIASGHAYAAEGHALFRVASYAKYGALSRRSRADHDRRRPGRNRALQGRPRRLRAVEAVDPGPAGLGQPVGARPAGLAYRMLGDERGRRSGETFDIHGGGLDLIFPHHENEIAQSVCAHDGHPFARYWLHNGMLTVGGAKMAKSEGNFVTVRDALKEWPGEVIRLALLMTHYRDPLDWTEDRLREAKTLLDHWYRALMLDGGPEAQADPSLVDGTTIESLAR